MSDLGLKFSQSVRKRCMNSCAKNGGTTRRRFSAIGEKPEGVFKHPPSAWRGLTYTTHRKQYDGYIRKRLKITVIAKKHVQESQPQATPHAPHPSQRTGASCAVYRRSFSFLEDFWRPQGPVVAFKAGVPTPVYRISVMKLCGNIPRKEPDNTAK